MKLTRDVFALLVLFLAACSDHERRNATIQRMNDIKAAIAAYEADFRRLNVSDVPSIFSQLVGGNPKKTYYIWHASYETDRFLDGWGHPFGFTRSASGKLIIHSVGPNGIMDSGPGSDDIFSIQK